MNVGCIASFIWGAVLLVNAISPFGWYPFSTKGEIYMLIGTTALCVGLLQSRSNIGMVNYREDDITVVSGVNKDSFPRIFFTIQLLIVILMIPMVIKAGRILISNNFNLYMVRYLYSNGAAENTLMNTFERLFYIHYVIGPCAHACIIIDAIICIENSFWKKPFIYLLSSSHIYTVAPEIAFIFGTPSEWS